ncbi:MAG: hypothetical protein E7080_09550 [Bacteroidales bacterium]|nr:hypothetical protein [Bacteroidales bacterium]
MVRGRFLSILIALISVFNIMAHGVTPIKSENLSSEQENTLRYAKKILKAQENKITLPLEVNALIGDTVAPEPYIATPLLDEAYFLSDTVFETSLIIPLKATTPKGEILSELKILEADKYTFCRVVTTQICYQLSDTITLNIDIDSNLNGIMLMTSVYENGVLKGQATGVASSFGVVDCSYESNYSQDLNKFRIFHTSIKAPDWRYSTIDDNIYRDILRKTALGLK